MKQFLIGLYVQAEALNRKNILAALTSVRTKYSEPRILDVGCNDGEWSLNLGHHAAAPTVHGLEIDPQQVGLATSRGVAAVCADLEETWPYEENQFDLVHANQVIEHLKDVDHFLSEATRVLKPGGTLIVSTENGSSWHNVFASALGWQIFSLTNVSMKRWSLGNPLALHRHEPAPAKSWTHRTIFNFRGLKELLAAHGLSDIRILGAGYHPLPAWLGRLDPRHAHFLTAVALKPALS